MKENPSVIEIIVKYDYYRNITENSPITHGTLNHT